MKRLLVLLKGGTALTPAGLDCGSSASARRSAVSVRMLRHLTLLLPLVLLVAAADAHAAAGLQVGMNDRQPRAGTVVLVTMRPAQPSCVVLVRLGGKHGRVMARQRVSGGRLKLAVTGGGSRTIEARCGSRRGYASYRVRKALTGGRSHQHRDGELDETAVSGAFKRSDGEGAGGPADFRLPFPCGERWRSSTYAGHGAALDWNDPARDDGGRPVVASAAGTAQLGTIGGWNGGYGNYVVVNHGGGWGTLYAHLRGYAVGQGATVSRGQVIGYVGTTGNSTGNHLHYEQRLNGVKQPIRVSFGAVAAGVTYSSENCNTTPNSPAGNWENWVRTPGGVRVSGWVADRDSSASTEVHIYVDGIGHARRADKPRPDVEAAGFPGAHGFDDHVPVAGTGDHRVCVYGINVAGTPGTNTEIRCQVLSINSDTIGALDEVRRVPGGVRVRGWTLDLDSGASLAAHVYSGANAWAYSADKERPDLAGTYPAYGTRHGINDVVPVRAGQQEICLFGINDPGSPGSNTRLGCRTVTVTSDPIGGFDSLTAVPGGAQATGWTLDPDTAAPIAVHFYRGTALTAGIADRSRPDVGSVHQEYGDAHGFDRYLPLPTGQHTICAQGVNVEAGGVNTDLGCRTVSVNAQPVAGDLDGDGYVGCSDKATLLSNFGKTGSGLKGDLNADNKVDITDLSSLLSRWSPPPGEPECP